MIALIRKLLFGQPVSGEPLDQPRFHTVEPDVKLNLNDWAVYINTIISKEC